MNFQLEAEYFTEFLAELDIFLNESLVEYLDDSAVEYLCGFVTESSGWLAGWLVGCLVGWLVGWLVCYLCG